MSKLITRIFLAASFLIVGGISAANAQLANGSVLRVDIPNSFILRDKSFPAGQYTIERTPNTNDSPSLLILRGENGKGMIFDTMAARSNEAAHSTQLIFDTVGGQYFLSKIWVKGDTAANEVPKTKAEKQMIARGPVRKVVITADTGF